MRTELAPIVLDGPAIAAALGIWSAHEFAASREAFRDLDELIAGTPSLSRQVARTNRSHGEEAIELYGDRRMLFKARSKGAGRALSADRTVLDEWLAEVRAAVMQDQNLPKEAR